LTKGSNGILERLSWKAILAGIISFLGLYFAFPEYLLDLRPQIEKSIGIGVLCFIEGAISGAIIVFVVLKILSERLKKTQTKKDKRVIMVEVKKTFRKWFYFFPSKWSIYKELIKSGSISKPEIEQPNTIADQLRFSFQDAQSVGFKFTLETKEKIEKIIDDLDKFGFDLRTRMKTLGRSPVSLNKTMSKFVERGEAIANAIKSESEDVESSLEVK